MSQPTTRHPAMLALLLALVASLLTFASAGTAQATESIPALQWPAVADSSSDHKLLASPTGDVTMSCARNDSASNLRTYDSSGLLVRELSHAAMIDGIPNCIERVAVDKNGDLYGQQAYASGYGSGQNLLAYDGNTLKWKYPTGCEASPVVGADGNIYTMKTGLRLIGLTPEVEPGQTLPEKIMDVAASHSCGINLQAFRHGLAVLESGLSAKATYYSYTGEKAGSIVYDRRLPLPSINADGQLFNLTSVSGSTFLNMYDPLTQKTVWTKSRPGVVSLHATPDGGVVASLQQTVSGNITRSLVKLDAKGDQSWVVALPSEDTNGNDYGAAQVHIDTNGKIIVVRSGSATTNSPSTPTVPTIFISTYDESGDPEGYEETLRGNTDTADGGVNGYTFHDAAPGTDTLYIRATCTGTCSGAATKTYPIAMSGLDLDYPRGDVLNANVSPQPPSVSYVPLGDSYSSGEGVEPFEAGTAEPGVNECHRSEKAYARVLEQDPWGTLDIGTGDFAACSGAVTDDITEGATPQSSKITADTDLVTITIGGNDMPFEDFATACALPFQGESCDETPYADAIAGVSNNVIPGVADMLTNLEGHLASLDSDATILVLGYPQIVPETWVSGAAGCWWLQSSETPAIRGVVDTLNTAIKNEVDAMGGNFHFVSATEDDSPFIGRELCHSTSTSTVSPTYFNNVIAGGPPEEVVYTFHPNEEGQMAYASIVRSYLLQHPLS